MMSDKCCRLCMSTSSSIDYLDIFSGIGVEMKMGEIISEHFKFEVSELDTMPSLVCQMCWQTTEAFHELYEISKSVQEKFQNPLIKVETDASEMLQSNKETHFIEESHVEFGPIKIEPDLDDESDIDDGHQMDYDIDNSNGSDGKSDEESIHEIAKDDPDFRDNKKLPEKYGCDLFAVKGRRQRSSTKYKNMEAKFAKLFKENEHLFDMTCDLCATTFKTLDEARTHYAKEHQNMKGYIKCCSTKLIYRCHVINHLQKHLESKSFKCTECPKVYWTQRELEKHIERHSQPKIPVHREKTIPCNVCTKMFSTKALMERHELKQHERRDESEAKFIFENFDMKCDYCDTIFGGFHDARHHYKRFHNDDKGYLKCCNIKLRKLWMVRDHVKSHLDPECFKCDVCSKNFSTRIMLGQHKRHHRLTMQKSFICDFCGKSCRDKFSITRHLFTNHVNSEPKFECITCHKKFQLKVLLKSHTYSVHREKKHNVTCEICGKGFYVKFHLDKHMLSHKDKSERLAQRKQCEHCGEWLMTKSGVFYHKQIHTTGTQKCPHCQIEVANKLALLGHIRQHHREHKFKCSYCDKTFSTSSAMKTHEESHTRHKVYNCAYCPRTFSIPSSRRTHTRRHHQDQKMIDKNNKNNLVQ